MSQPLVLVDADDPAVVTLTLNRPEKRNALSVALMAELCTAVESAGSNPAARVLVLRGAGKAFCAGLDLEEAADPTKAEASAELIARMLRVVYGSPLVTLAAAHGGAIAGGAGLMMACDLVVAADDLRVGFPEVHRGLVAGLVMTFLRRQVHERHARELLLLGEWIDASAALTMGIVNRVVPAARLNEDAIALAAQAAQGAPGAVARTKKLLDGLWPRSVGDDLDEALRHHMAARNSAEAREGVAAFLEKRPPRWGRGRRDRRG